MKSVWITRHGGPEVLEVRETADPEPGPGELRVRARAAGLNFAELSARQGLYPDAPPPPCVVGYEVAGVVDKLGEGVTEPAIGSRVLAMVRFGGHSDTVVLPAQQAVPMPDDMSFEEGAAIPVNYLTAHHMLFRVANLQPGETVLVHMAAGGVGIAALQLCGTVPDITVLGTSSASKHDLIREQGCDHPIDYRNLDYEAEVMRLTDGKGVHVVLDALGGKDWRKGRRLLRPVGRLICFGFANSSKGPKRNIPHLIKEMVQVPVFTPWGLLNDNHLIAGVHMGHLWDEQHVLLPQVARVVELYRQGVVKPRVDKVFPFAEAGAAHQYMHDRKNVGKVVLAPD